MLPVKNWIRLHRMQIVQATNHIMGKLNTSIPTKCDRSGIQNTVKTSLAAIFEHHADFGSQRGSKETNNIRTSNTAEIQSMNTRKLHKPHYIEFFFESENGFFIHSIQHFNCNFLPFVQSFVHSSIRSCDIMRTDQGIK